MIHVLLALAKLSIIKKIEKVRFIIASMTGNAYFPTPNPPLTTITNYTNALEAASIAAQGGGKDDTAAMHMREQTLDLALTQLGYYVEGIANASPANAETIILSAGMDVRGKGTRVTVEFEAKPTGTGKMKLIHRSVERGIHEFQMCTDPSNEANWERIYAGTRGTFEMTGLTSGTRYYFRATVINKKGIGAWTVVISMIAL